MSDDKGGPPDCDKKDSSKKLKDKISKPQLSGVGDNAKQLLTKASAFIEKSSSLKQLAIGTGAGWCTGFVATKVGRTAAFTVGGTIILVAAAGQTGLIRLNWDKINKNVSQASEKVEDSVSKNYPKIHGNVSKYARANKYFAAGFIGGFLLGACS